MASASHDAIATGLILAHVAATQHDGGRRVSCTPFSHAFGRLLRIVNTIVTWLQIGCGAYHRQVHRSGPAEHGTSS